MEFLSPPSTPCKKKRNLTQAALLSSPTNKTIHRNSNNNFNLDFNLKLSHYKHNDEDNFCLYSQKKHQKRNDDCDNNDYDVDDNDNYILKSPKSVSKSQYSSIERLPPSLFGDRFIPQRKNIDFEYCNDSLHKKENSTDGNLEKTAASIRYNQRIIDELCPSINRRLLPLFESANKDNGGNSNSNNHNHHNNNSKSSHFHPMNMESDQTYYYSPTKKLLHRILPSGASRILDAPDLMDDYYLNLLHWGSLNTIAVALKNSVYLWNASDGRIDQLLSLDDESDYVGSVKWSTKNPHHIAIGTNHNTVQIWDVSSHKMIREMIGHSARVGALSWNQDIISSGSRDSNILNHDLRQRRNIINRYCGHQQEICGLSWSPDGTTLASGGNENLLCLWDITMSSQSRGGPLQSMADTQPRVSINDHQAAVKALAWCPWIRNTLASGGGTADRTIRIWNTSLGSNVKVVDTGSQVCALEWNSRHKELLSSHGFSDNQLILWNYPSMTKIKEFRGHNARVLHLAQSPDEGTICSASADETLRFWDIFSGGKVLLKSKDTSNSPMRCLDSMKSNFSLSLR